MNVTLVEINIKPERVDEFLEVFRANHEGQSRSRETCVLTYCRTRGSKPGSLSTRPIKTKRRCWRISKPALRRAWIGSKS